MTDTEERRRRRAASQERFDGIADDYLGDPVVSRGRMFGSEGLRVHGRYIAFVDADGGIIVKVPAEAAAGLVAAGAAEPVSIGRNPAREWVTVPPAADGDLQPWRDLVADAYRYATRQR